MQPIKRLLSEPVRVAMALRVTLACLAVFGIGISEAQILAVYVAADVVLSEVARALAIPVVRPDAPPAPPAPGDA